MLIGDLELCTLWIGDFRAETVTEVMVDSAQSSYSRIRTNPFTLIEQFNFGESECSRMERSLEDGQNAASGRKKKKDIYIIQNDRQCIFQSFEVTAEL